MIDAKGNVSSHAAHSHTRHLSAPFSKLSTIVRKGQSHCTLNELMCGVCAPVFRHVYKYKNVKFDTAICVISTHYALHTHLKW